MQYVAENGVKWSIEMKQTIFNENIIIRCYYYSTIQFLSLQKIIIFHFNLEQMPYNLFNSLFPFYVSHTKSLEMVLFFFIFVWICTRHKLQNEKQMLYRPMKTNCHFCLINGQLLIKYTLWSNEMVLSNI